MIAALLAITTGGVYLGAVVAARHRAQSAADLAALAGAGRLANGTVAACSQASAVAGAIEATVTDCIVDELDVVVLVEVNVQLGRFDVGPARARARAGPAEASP